MKYKFAKIITVFLIASMVFFTNVETVQAQCPMCKMSAESNLKDGGTAGKGLNAGILYLFAAPYLLVGTLGFLWYRNRKKRQAEEEEQAIQDLMN